MKLLHKIAMASAGCATILSFMTSCSDNKSYADLLRDETICINEYLADQRVEGGVPADSVFVTRRGIAEKIFRESGEVAANQDEYDEKVGKIMDALAADPTKDAPYYRMDEDGNVYMRVISTGDMETRPKYDDLVYMRFIRYNLFYYADGEFTVAEGNAVDVSYSESIRYGNYQSTSSVTWGEGIQLPLSYLGYGCNVEIVLRSQVGRNDEIASVVPYMYSIRYYKSYI